MARRTTIPTVWKWVIAGAIGSVLLSPLAYLTARHFVRQRVLGWRDDGLAAAEARDYPRAVDLLGRYLHRNPRDVRALEAYVKCSEQTESDGGRNVAEMVSALKSILQQDPDRLEDRRELLDLYVRLSRRPEALDIADSILKKYPLDAQTLGARTKLLAAMHQDRDALDTSERWVTAAPNELAPQMARMSARFRLGQPADDIVADARKSVDSHPDDPRAQLLLGFALAQAGNTEEAATWLRKAAAHAQNTQEFAETLVSQFDVLGQPNEGVAVLQNLINHGAGPEIRHDLARRYWEHGRWDSLLPLLTDEEASDPSSDPTLVGMRIMAMEGLHQTQQADTALADLAHRSQAAAQAWNLLLQRPKTPQQNNDKAIIKECRMALTLDPENPYLTYYLGETFYRQGETDLALGAWARATDERPTWTLPANRLADTLLQDGKAQEALWVAAATARQNKSDLPAVVALSRAWAAVLGPGDVTESANLLKLVNDVQRLVPGEPQTLAIQIELLAADGRTDDAIAAGKRLIEGKHVPDEHVLSNLASVSRRYKLGLQAECFSVWERQYGITSSLAYTRAADASVNDRGVTALKTFDGLAQQAGKSDDLNWKLSRVRLQDATGEANAPAALKALSDAYPSDLTVQTTVAGARSVQGNWDVMMPVVDRLRAIQGDDALSWQLLKARLEIDSARTENDTVQGSLLLSNLIKVYPALADARVMLARALMRMKQLDGAVDQLRIANQLDLNSVPIALEYAAALQTQGNFTLVKQVVEHITPQLRTWSQRRGAALILSQSGAADQALALMNSRVETTQESSAGQNDLFMAMLYHQQHQDDQAEQIIKTLMANPNMATIEFASSFYSSLNRMDDAHAVLAKLDSMQLNPGVKEMAIGEFDYNTGDIPGALAQYEIVTQKSPGSPVAWQTLAATQVEAGQMDKVIATIKAGAQADPKSAALQMLAQKSDLMEQSLSDDGLKPTILLLIHHPLNNDVSFQLLSLVNDARQQQDLQAMATRLGDFIQKNPDCVGAYVRLINCYRQMNRYTDAERTAQQALAEFPNDEELYRFAVDVSSTDKRWNEMLSIAETWKKKSGTPEADVAVAQAMNGLGQYEEAQNILRQYLPLLRSSPDRYQTMFSTYCVSVANRDPKWAADALWPLVQKSPVWRGQWITLASSLNDTQEAETWLTRISTVIPDSDLRNRLSLASAEGELGERLNDPAMTERAMATSRELANNTPTNFMVQLVAGLQEEAVGDLKSAELFYRRAIKDDPTSWVADNNLAMVMLRQNESPQEALEYAQKAAAEHPDTPDVMDTLAQAQAKAGDNGGAAATIRTALKYQPDNAAWRVRLIEYLLDSGKPTDAAQALTDFESDLPDSGVQAADVRKMLASVRKRIRGNAN